MLVETKLVKKKVKKLVMVLVSPKQNVAAVAVRAKNVRTALV